jgi:hypothetical protein
MNNTDLNNFEEFEKKQLILKISGEVQQSNLAEFEEAALLVIGAINTDLQTDEDFAEAEQNVKSCKAIEVRIAQARQDAIMQTADIAALIQTTERLEAKFRQTRLMLDGKVKTEKEQRKNEIINAGRNHIQGLLVTSPVKHGFVVDNKAFTEAAKGKRSLAKIEEAVREVVTAEEFRLASLEETYQLNIIKINKAEEEYPGLFPDKSNISLSPGEVVDSQIESRIATFRFNVLEKERKEKERLEAEKAIKEKVVEVKPPEQPGFIPPPPPEFEQQIPDLFTIVVTLSTTDISAKLAEIRAIHGVKNVKVEMA